MKNNKILFSLDSRVKDYAEPPLPIKNNLADWYKSAKPLIGEKKFTDANPHLARKTMKSCVPFMDSMISGYVFNTPCDFSIKHDPENNDFSLSWKELGWKWIEDRKSDIYQGLTVPDNYYNRQVAFFSPLYIKTPPGYSVLITQPFNRFDLPFMALTGIVDTDVHPMFPGNYPIYAKKGTHALIEKGTPLLQIIPFKRESWLSEIDDDLERKAAKSRFSAASVFSNWYRRNAWSKKEYL